MPRVARRPPKATLKKKGLQYQVLVLMRDQGLSVSKAAKSVGVSPATVYKWSKVDAAFQVEYKKILASPAHRERLQRRGSATTLKTDDGIDISDWKQHFLKLLMTEHTRVEALDIIEKKALELDRALEEDEIFRLEYEEVCRREEMEIEDRLRQRAKGSATDARAYMAYKRDAQQVERVPDPGSGTRPSEVERTRERAKAAVKKRRFTDPETVPLSHKPDGDEGPPN